MSWFLPAEAVTVVPFALYKKRLDPVLVCKVKTKYLRRWKQHFPFLAAHKHEHTLPRLPFALSLTPTPRIGGLALKEVVGLLCNKTQKRKIYKDRKEDIENKYKGKKKELNFFRMRNSRDGGRSK